MDLQYPVSNTTIMDGGVKTSYAALTHYEPDKNCDIGCQLIPDKSTRIMALDDTQIEPWPSVAWSNPSYTIDASGRLGFDAPVGHNYMNVPATGCSHPEILQEGGSLLKPKRFVHYA